MASVLTLEKISALRGSVNLIGSKSLTNRALLLSALSSGTTVLRNILRSDDSKVMLAALRSLGVCWYCYAPSLCRFSLKLWLL